MINRSELINVNANEETLRRCPHCESAWLHDRVPRAWWVKTFFFFLPLKRYVCYKCKSKPYLIDWKHKLAQH